MPRGSTQKRERQYEDLKHEFEETGRYEGREEEVAARIVNKQRRQFGETRGAERADREGRSPDRDLPIRDYERLTIPEIKAQLGDLGPGELRTIQRFEEQHRHRKGVLQLLERELKTA